MYFLNGLQNFIAFFSKEYAYMLASERVLKIITDWRLPQLEGFNITCTAYTTCMSTYLGVSIERPSENFKYACYYDQGKIASSHTADSRSHLYRHIRINDGIGSYEDLKKKLVAVGAWMHNEARKEEEIIEKYKPLFDAKAKFILNNLFGEDAEASAEALVYAQDIDEFVELACSISPVVDKTEYKQYIINRFREEAKGKKVEFDTKHWVMMPLYYKRINDQIQLCTKTRNERNAACASILNEINGEEIVKCQTYEECVAREG